MAIILGTNQNDTLVGTTGDDLIIGGGGDDVLHGGGGHDQLYGGDGNDIMFSDGGTVSFYGGDGIDTADFDGATHGVTANLAAGDVSYGGLVSYDLKDTENLIGSNFNDTLIGDKGDNVIKGGGGDDVLRGGGGHDQLYGGDGNDIMYSDGGAVSFYGGAGTDTVDFSGATHGLAVDLEAGKVSYSGLFLGNANNGYDVKDVENVNGSAFNDDIIGSKGDNVLNGGAGNDMIFGGGGHDKLNGGDGDDLLYSNIMGLEDGVADLDGGSGNDTADFSFRGATGVHADLALGWVSYDGQFNLPQETRYALVNIENLNGSDFNDSLTGDAGNNVLRGNAGNDALWGGGGADTFAYGPEYGMINFGKDTIFDFAAGQDHVQFDHTLFANYAAVQAHMAQVGTDTVISYDANDTVTLHNVQMASLHASDFVFV